MNKLLRKTATGIATAALLANALTPLAFASVSVEVSGNGAQSDNNTNVSVSNTTGVAQSNTANIQNNVSVGATSGGNSANYNTGGNVSVDTGSASSNVTVKNTANSNAASVSGCCASNVDVSVTGNGEKSDNDANVSVNKGKNDGNSIVQTNVANVGNNVSSNLNTGDNKAKYNTGGDVSIGTGNAKGTVDLSTDVNKNVAEISGDGNGTLGVWISGNGAKSDNDVKVKVGSSNIIEQGNLANISNDVEMWANSGDNKAKYNTGGDVSVDTGNAVADVSVGNMANFNSADLGSCGNGCEISGTVKVKDNGYDSDNDANVTLASANWATQANDLECDDFASDACASVSANSNTGNNNANSNTQGNGEPSISTGSAGGDVTVDNTANQNVVGDVDMNGIQLPSFNFQGGSISGLLVMLLGLFSGQTV